MNVYRGEFLRVTSLLYFLSLYSMTVSAVPTYIWNNRDGLVKGINCGPEAIQTNRFRISTHVGSGDERFENLRSVKGVGQSNLPVGSVIKLLAGKKIERFNYVEAVGIHPPKSKNRWQTERGDKGYLYSQSSLDIDDYVFEVENNFSVFQLDSPAVLQVVIDNNSYQKIVCQNTDVNRDYLAFYVFSSTEGVTPVGILGIFYDETEILSKIKTYELGDYLKVITAPGREFKLAALMDKNNSKEEIAKLEMENRNDIAREKSSHNPIDEDPIKKVENLDQVVCVAKDDRVNVRDASLEKVMFTTSLGEGVKVYNGFSSKPKQKYFGNNNVTFVKVVFLDRESGDQVTGWIAQAFVKYKDECGEIEDMSPPVLVESKPKSDSECCEFPTKERATQSYLEGARSFKASRFGGKRLHGADDIYRNLGDPVMAVADGKIIQGPYAFYKGTYAIEIQHEDGFVVRYGEVTSKKPKNIGKNATVSFGQTVGYVGQVQMGKCCHPMLHFEMYSGKKSGPLTIRNHGKFDRRDDLIDPTEYLRVWERSAFGVSF